MSPESTHDPYHLPQLSEVALPHGFWFVAVDGRPRRPDAYTNRAKAEKSAREIARYCPGQRVLVFRAEPEVAFVDDPNYVSRSAASCPRRPRRKAAGDIE